MRNCPACQRPVRRNETACPFCAAALVSTGDAGPVQRLAIGSAIVAAAATATGCFLATPVYGAPAPPSASPSSGPSASPSPIPSATPSGPIAAPLYGAPAPPR